MSDKRKTTADARAAEIVALPVADGERVFSGVVGHNDLFSAYRSHSKGFYSYYDLDHILWPAYLGDQPRYWRVTIEPVAIDARTFRRLRASRGVATTNETSQEGGD